VRCRPGSGSGQSPALPGEDEGSEGINIERSNKGIARDVRAELRSDRRLEAVAAARGIPGVNGAVENLTVRHVAPWTLHEFQTRAQDILIWDPVVDESALEAFVLQGVLILEGAVDAYWKKLLLEERLSCIRGIVKVENRLEVVREGEIEDATIAKEVVEVRDRIHPDSEKIGVEVSRHEKEIAGRLAKGIRGVRGLVNGILVEQARRRPDAEIERAVLDSLSCDPRVGPFDLRDRAERGRAREIALEGGAVIVGSDLVAGLGPAEFVGP
jgi:osmotically-inducible protein OsmY